MTQLTNTQIGSTYGDVLTTTNNGQGLPAVTPVPIQDGLGNNSPILMSQTQLVVNTSASLSFSNVTVQKAIVGGTTPFEPPTFSPLEILGNFAQKGVTSGWTNTYVLNSQDAIQTVNAVPTALLGATTSVKNATFIINGTLIARAVNSNDGLYAEFTATTIIDNLGNSTIIGAPTITLNATAGLAACTASFATISGPLVTIGVVVDGIAATTINWLSTFQSYLVTNSTA